MRRAGVTKQTEAGVLGDAGLGCLSNRKAESFADQVGSIAAGTAGQLTTAWGAHAREATAWSSGRPVERTIRHGPHHIRGDEDRGVVDPAAALTAGTAAGGLIW